MFDYVEDITDTKLGLIDYQAEASCSDIKQ